MHLAQFEPELHAIHVPIALVEGILPRGQEMQTWFVHEFEAIHVDCVRL